MISRIDLIGVHIRQIALRFPDCTRIHEGLGLEQVRETSTCPSVVEPLSKNLELWGGAEHEIEGGSRAMEKDGGGRHRDNDENETLLTSATTRIRRTSFSLALGKKIRFFDKPGEEGGSREGDRGLFFSGGVFGFVGGVIQCVFSPISLIFVACGGLQLDPPATHEEIWDEGLSLSLSVSLACTLARTRACACVHALCLNHNNYI